MTRLPRRGRPAKRNMILDLIIDLEADGWSRIYTSQLLPFASHRPVKRALAYKGYVNDGTGVWTKPRAAGAP